MKIIKLNWLTITNFKGIESLHIDFSDETNIWGANEAGKTSVSDAWHWLLTGKDSLDREKFGIKNTVLTNLNRSNHEVSAGITVDGEEITLKRIYKENWVKPKGQAFAQYSGNSQEFTYNEVPLNAGEFKAKIDAFLNENILKMLTNPAYFNRLKWQDQRAVLTEMGGSISDAEILDKIATVSNKGAIDNITNILNTNKTLAEYKKQLSASKKLKKDLLDAIPNRIDEVTRSMPEVIDYSVVEAQVKDKQSAIADIDILMNDETAAFNKANQENTTRQLKISGLNLDLINAENSIRSNHQKASNEVALKATQAANNIQNVTLNINSKNLLISSTQSRIDVLTKEKADLLTKWHEENAKVLVYDDHKFTCPTCLRGLEAENIEATKKQMDENFVKEQTANKLKINTEGKAKAAQITEAETLIDTLKNQLITLREQLAEFEKIADEISPAKQVDINKLIAEDEKVIAIKKEIEVLKAENADVKPVDLTEQRNLKASIQNEINALQTALAGKSQREKLEKRLVELKNEEAELSQQIADLEGIEFSIAEFDKAKVTETEKRVNELFGSGVTFKMYNYTLDNNPVDTCEALFKGVPYNDLNTAGKVQCGLIIINALSKFYGVEAPIFIDNKESISTLPETHCQIINLIVSPVDTLLRVA